MFSRGGITYQASFHGDEHGKVLKEPDVSQQRGENA